MKNRIVILLTACVNPNGMARTALQDGDVRKQQYKDALNYYLQKTELPIVFVENTNVDFSNDFQSYIDTGRLEYHTFDGNNYELTIGKGFGEAKIIEYAFNNSCFLNHAVYVIKITGRVKILNIKEIYTSKLLRLPNVCRCSFLEKRFIITSAIVLPRGCLKDFVVTRCCMINDDSGNCFERVLHDYLASDKKVIVIPFYNPLQIDGISGTFNRPYISPSKMENIYRNLNFAIDFYIISNKKIPLMILRICKFLFNKYCKYANKTVKLTDCY